MVSRAALAVVVATLVAASPVVAPMAAASMAVAPASATGASATPDDVAPPVAPKVVIVVGPTEGTTPSYRSFADSIAATALKYTSNVVKIYSPKATWAAVSAAAQGASIFVDLGHGWGFPSPYTSTLSPSSEDGMALNAAANQGDSNRQYYGESWIANDIRLAPNAIVFLNHLCYAPGASESGNPEPTIPVAQQRVDNFASGYIRAGARAVIADDGVGTVEAAIKAIFTTHQSVLSAWRSMPDAEGHEIPWAPARNPAFQAVMDPTTWTSGFMRSIVTDTALRTDDVLAGAALVPTAPTLTAPGAAAVGAAPAPLFTDQALATSAGTSLAGGTALRVDQIVPGTTNPDSSVTPTAVQVHTLDGLTSGWVDAADLVPRDSGGPQLLSTTGPTTISPNFDGVDDQLALWMRLSEAASWTFSVQDGDGNVLRSQTGTSDLFAASWDGIVSGAPAPAGTYGWTLHATDALGNPPLDASGSFTVVDEPVPPTAVLDFSSLLGAYTNAADLAYQLTFATDVTGLTASDIGVSGTSIGCTVATPTGSGTSWYLTVSGCSAGTVTLTLAADSVLDPVSVPGPAAAVVAPSVRVDRARPTTSTPAASLRSGVVLASTSFSASLTWSGSDAGAGVASYDVMRSLDGGAFATLKTGLTSPSLGVTLTSGHSYRFEVRAHDRAGNTGVWVAGPTLKPALVQETTTAASWSSGWLVSSLPGDSGGAARTTTRTAASVSYAFTGRAIAVVVTRDPAYGQLKVYLDGSLVATVDTQASSHGYRSVVFARALASGSHTLKLVTVGTAGRPRVVIDAFEVVR